MGMGMGKEGVRGAVYKTCLMQTHSRYSNDVLPTGDR